MIGCMIDTEWASGTLFSSNSGSCLDRYNYQLRKFGSEVMSVVFGEFYLILILSHDAFRFMYMFLLCVAFLANSSIWFGSRFLPLFSLSAYLTSHNVVYLSSSPSHFVDFLTS